MKLMAFFGGGGQVAHELAHRGRAHPRGVGGPGRWTHL